MLFRDCFKKTLLFLFAVLMVVSLTGCDEDEIDTGISVSEEMSELVDTGKDTSLLFSDGNSERENDLYVSEPSFLSDDSKFADEETVIDPDENFGNELAVSVEDEDAAVEAVLNVTEDTSLQKESADADENQNTDSSVTSTVIPAGSVEISVDETPEIVPNEVAEPQHDAVSVKTENNISQENVSNESNVKDSVEEQESEKVQINYILNKNTKKFHYDHCGSVSQIKAKNRGESSDRNEIISKGYTPCKRCNP